eukprot:COSAG02_NODE_5882_length_3965_cov_11.810657_2_plen_150_part_00
MAINEYIVDIETSSTDDNHHANVCSYVPQGHQTNGTACTGCTATGLDSLQLCRDTSLDLLPGTTVVGEKNTRSIDGRNLRRARATRGPIECLLQTKRIKILAQLLRCSGSIFAEHVHKATARHAMHGVVPSRLTEKLVLCLGPHLDKIS